MQRICFVLQVKPDRLEEYKRRHREVWPDMLSALRETGWTNYSLFLRPDGMLVGYLETNDFAAARPYLETVVRLQPDDLAPKQNLARALEATRDLDGAARQYRDILTTMPGADLTRALLSDVLMKQSRPDEALQLLEEGLKIDPNAAIMYREKGRILDRQGRNADAIRAYQEYVRLSPGASDIRAFTARIEQLTAVEAQ